MSNYQTRLAAAVPEARRLVADKGAEIRQVIPSFHARDFDRLTKSLAALLERVDKAKVDHPEYLAHPSGNLAEYCVQLVEGVPSSMAAGTSHFLQTTLPTLLGCEDQLLKAVGSYFYQAKELKGRHLREMQKLAAEALDFRQQALDASETATKAKASSSAALKEIATLRTQAASDSAKVTDLRKLVEKLASGDGRGRSLEALKRQAEQKLEDIEDVLAKGGSAAATVENVESELRSSLERFQSADRELADLRIRADQVLALSNQAGLAASYKKEATRLAWRSLAFTVLLYVVTGAAIYFAVEEILPGMATAIDKIGPDFSAFEAIVLALLRAVLILPLLYAIYFTSKRVTDTELLRMDYSEKAAASLAYSGYSEQMEADESLLNQLKASLLVKFNEHPERLLGRGRGSTRTSFKVPGYEVATESSTEGRRARPRADPADEEE